MKNKCYILKSALLLALIAFVFGAILFLIRSLFDTGILIGYLYDLSVTFFACSLLVFILSIKDYLNARNEFMKEFWAEANSVNNELKNINYIFMDIPNKLITRNIDDDKISKKLRNYIYEYYDDSELDELKGEDLENHISLIVTEEREKLIKALNKEIKNYLNVSKVSLSKLNYLIHDAEFFRITIKENMTNYIYQPLYDVYKDIKSLANDIECSDFKEESLLTILKEIKTIQEKLFAEVYEKDKIKVLYGLTYKIERALETWRSFIYHDGPVYEEQLVVTTVKPKTTEDKLRHIKGEEEHDEE